MRLYRSTEPLDRDRHLTESFACGQTSLDRWLVAYAAQGQQRDASRTFVVAEQAGRVLGYYTLVATEIVHEGATLGVRPGMSRRFPIPVALIARLAIDQPHQGQGLGRSLLLDALQRIDRASSEIGLRAVLVHAIDERAADFYSNYGFEASGLDPHTLMVAMTDVRRVIGSNS